MAISPHGDQLVVTARGDVFVANLEHDTVHRVVSGSGVRERGASYYDDEWLLLVTENDGEQEIAMVPVDGSENPGVLTEGTHSWLFPPLASLDGRWVVYGDRSGALLVIDMNTLEQREVALCEHGEITDYRISPDGRWVAWSMPDANAISQVHIAMLEGERTWQVGDGMHHDSAPRWDPAGVYLWFFSDRGLNPRIGSIEFRHTYTQTTRVYALALTEDAPPPDPVAMAAIDFDAETWSMPPPWLEEEVPGEDEVDEVEEADAVPPEADEPEPEGFEPMRLDTDGMSRRIHPVALSPGDYGNLEATWGGFLFLSMPPMGLFEQDAAWESGDDGPPSSLHQYDVATGELNMLADYVDAFVINTDRDVIIAESEDGYLTVDPVCGEATLLASAPILMEINSRQEWAQILDESWRLQRDFFWNPHYNGVDWVAMRAKYAARLDRVGTRTELEDLTGRMLSELQASHAYTWGGDSTGGADYVPFAMLGADLSPVDGGFRIDSIVPGRSWDEATISPLDQSWLGISVGDVIIGIDGKAVEPGDNPWSLLEGVAGDTVELVIAPGGRWASAYAVDVPVAWDEGALRYQAWVDANRRAVEEASDGRFGYLHLIDMGGAGLSQFAHQYYGQADRDGLV
ncbi:MAG: PDZ domain-containing protein, partial [Myxococcota bacterium]